MDEVLELIDTIFYIKYEIGNLQISTRIQFCYLLLWFEALKMPFAFLRVM